MTKLCKLVSVGTSPVKEDVIGLRSRYFNRIEHTPAVTIIYSTARFCNVGDVYRDDECGELVWSPLEADTRVTLTSKGE